MQLINWQGAILGPGSEWFWSMLQFIIVAGTLIGLYRQLRLQSSTSAIAQLQSWDAEWMSERNTRYRLDVLVALRDGIDPADVPLGAGLALVNFWEKIGTLARKGHLDQRLLWSVTGSDCASWWSTLAPMVRKLRAQSGDPLIYEHFEWLAGIMTDLDRKVAVRVPDEQPALGGWLQGIAICEHQLQVEQALRTVVLASPDVGQATAAMPPPVEGTAVKT